MGQPYSNIQTIFSRGELSPRMIGRVDNKSYFNAVKYSQNMIPYPQGSITKRPGTYYVKPVKTSANTTILIPFRFSTVQNYMLEFGNLYFRVYRNRGNVESSPGVPYEVTTPWPSSVLKELYYVQSADTLYVFHPDYQPQVITRTSDTSWTITALTFIDGPWLPTNASAVTIAASATTGVITLTASAATFASTDVGRQVRLGTNRGYATITAYTDTTHVTATVGDAALSGTAATAVWRFSYFGGTVYKWPSKATIYEERMILANTRLYPSTIFASVTGDFTRFSPTEASGNVVDDDGFVVTIGDDQVNSINWLSSGRQLMIGTAAAAHSMSGGTGSSYAPLTPSNVTIKREATYGARENIRSIRVGSSVFYLSYSGLKLRNLYYDFSQDNYASEDSTIFNSHITYGGIVDMDFQSEPDPTIWTVRADGQLIGFTYDKANEIQGWHRHILGGTSAAVKAVACIPRPDKSGDDVWLIVQRTINGAVVQYVEYIKEYFDEAAGQKTAFYVDCGLTYDGYRAGTITAAATTGTGITFTASSAIFTAGDVGNQIRAGTGRGLITAYTDSTHVVVTITAAFASTSAVATGSWSVATNDVTGLSHLEAETVSVWADGAVQPSQVVVSGAINLTSFVSYVSVGCPYRNYMILLPIEAPQLGTIQGRVRGVSRIHVYLTSTMTMEYGCLTPDNSDTDIIPTLHLDVSMFDTAPGLINGIQTLDVPTGYGQDCNLYLGQNAPTPMTVNYVVQEISVNG